MGLGFFSSNKTISIVDSSVVTQFQTTVNSSGTSTYTVPTGHVFEPKYLIASSISGFLTLSVGELFVSYSGGGAVSIGLNPGGGSAHLPADKRIICGPGAVLTFTWSHNGSGTGRFTLAGVLYKNTP